MTKILIVEDNLDYAEDMAEFLVELEHEVHITSSAGGMWTALSHGNVGVVVLDLGLRLGADHYLTKPIKFPELAAHIEALDRRVGPQDPVPEPGKWTLKVSARQLELMGAVIALTEKEFNFLHLLTINTRPVPRDVIVAGMGGEDPDAGRRVDMLVYRLRKKAKTGLGQDLPLRSAYGEGYSLSASFNLS